MAQFRQKGPVGTPRDQSERIIKKIQERGDIFELSIGLEGAGTSLHFEKATDLKLKGKKKPLQVSFSSMDQENDSLLHFLLNKAKS